MNYHNDKQDSSNLLKEETNFQGIWKKEQEVSILSDPEAYTNLYKTGYYGTYDQASKILVLSPEETILLIERKKLEITNEDEHQILTISEIINKLCKKNHLFWAKYLVYKDLRNRGYVVRKGFGKHTSYRVYPRGAQAEQSVANIAVFPMISGTSIDLETLDSVVSQTQRDRKKLVLAMVDRIGDITYYTTSQMNLKENKQIYEYPSDDFPVEETEVSKETKNEA